MLRKHVRPADIGGMGRALALPLLLIVVSVGGFLFVRQAQTRVDATTAAAATDFAAARPVLRAWFADHGTYSGVRLPARYRVAVVRADATSYCLEARRGGRAAHELGPKGKPLSGRC